METKLIQKWLSDGLITPDQSEIMLADLAQVTQEKSSSRFLSVISILGSVFLGVGVIWIVAANWIVPENFVW